MKNKKGEQNSLIWIIVGIIVVVVLMNSGFLSPKQTTTTTQTPISSASCALQPAVVAPTATDALQPGTAIGGLTTYYKKNGIYVGTSVPTVSKGDSIQELVDNGTAIGIITDAFTVDCGNNPKEVQMKTYANASISVYTNTGNSILTNAATGGAVNETATSAGGSLNNKIHIVGNDKKTTGSYLLIVEMSSPTNVSSMTLSGATTASVPNGYSRQLTNGYIAAFTLPAIDGNSASDFNLQTAANTNYVLNGTVYMTFIAQQPFVDTDGSFKIGAYDSLNVYKGQDKQTYNYVIR